MVIPCGEIDLDWLKENRDQLFAETLCYPNFEGEKVVELPKELWEEQEERSHQHRITSELEDYLKEKLPKDGDYYIKKTDLTEYLRDKEVKYSNHDLHNTMTAMGWRNAGKRVGEPKKFVRVWCLGDIEAAAENVTFLTM